MFLNNKEGYLVKQTKATPGRLKGLEKNLDYRNDIAGEVLQMLARTQIRPFCACRAVRTLIKKVTD